MDEFDFKEEKPKAGSKVGPAIWNCASMIFFFGALAVALFFLVLFLNPQSEFNPFPPAAVAPTEAAADTATATTFVEVTPTETATNTPKPPTATPTIDEAGGFFGIQEGSPAAQDSSIFHPEMACDYLGIAGQAFDLNGVPVSGLQVHVGGTLNGEPVDKVGLTGAATQFGAGSYYEVQLASSAVASENTLQVTLLNAEGGPVSNVFTFSTTASCQANINFIKFAEQP
jgi:hypothetical protein